MFPARVDKFKPDAGRKAPPSRRTASPRRAQSVCIRWAGRIRNRGFYLFARSCRAARDRASKRSITKAKTKA